jgi:hypothetical protein
VWIDSHRRTEALTTLPMQQDTVGGGGIIIIMIITMIIIVMNIMTIIFIIIIIISTIHIEYTMSKLCRLSSARCRSSSGSSVDVSDNRPSSGETSIECMSFTHLISHNALNTPLRLAQQLGLCALLLSDRGLSLQSQLISGLLRLCLRSQHLLMQIALDAVLVAHEVGEQLNQLEQHLAAKQRFGAGVELRLDVFNHRGRQSARAPRIADTQLRQLARRIERRQGDDEVSMNVQFVFVARLVIDTHNKSPIAAGCCGGGGARELFKVVGVNCTQGFHFGRLNVE